MPYSTRPLAPFFATALMLLGTMLSVFATGTVVTLTPDEVNSSAAGFGSSIAATLDDAFAYDLDDPAAILPAQAWASAAGFHGNEADGVDVLISYTMPATTPAAGETFVIDVYGRFGDNCCEGRDNDFDIEFYSGGIGGTLVETQENLAIPDTEPVHLRVTYAAGLEIDSLRIVARDAEAIEPVGSYFTLLEIRAALIDPIIDTDGDGLPDAWEDSHSLDKNDNGDIDPINGAAGDPDNDQLDNLGEFDAKTNPRDDDSDDDTLLDGPEVTGVGSRPPTNPLAADTDNDTLSDLVETNTGVFASAADTGSNPTLPDTDSDGAGDADEVRRSTDPNDAGSGSNIALGKTVGFFDATGAPTGAWAGFPPESIIDGNLASISHTLDQASSDYYFELDLGEEVSIGFLSLSGRGYRDNCCADRLENVTLTILDEARNPVHSETLDGQIQFTREVDLTPVQPRGRFVQIINSGGADYGPQLGELEVYGSSAPPVPLEITAFSIDPDSGDASLTWRSRPGTNYSVTGTADLRSLAEVNDNVPSGGESTTLVFTDLDLTGKTRYFYIVRKNPSTPN